MAVPYSFAVRDDNHQLPAAIQATQDKISGSVKLQMPLLWIGPKSW